MNKKIRFLIKNICNFLVQIIIVFEYVCFLIAIIFIQLNYAPNKKRIILRSQSQRAKRCRLVGKPNNAELVVKVTEVHA
jgi:hypothetical protein